jgi:cysteinyl-tRNA synthetase
VFCCIIIFSKQDSKFMLKFHNTLTNQLEDFHPIKDGEVKMYICGPTVWNFAHIGNFRTFVFGDILRRYLKFKGFKLTHVMNLTDVDDRIINEAVKQKITIDEMTAPFITAFWEDCDALGLERPEIAPRATEHIAEMIEIISTLLENGRAYESDGSIYYRIAAFPEYGKLSKIKFEGNIVGGSERIDTDKYEKEDARDFALWKLVGEDETPGWDAPFGRGRPGWHIECSAMSMKYLGETFDIHAGGIDLQFPHHENEIAQSEGATGKLFSKYWLHGEFLKIENEKMSKSLGNDFNLRDILNRGFKPLAIRYLLFSVPYDKQLNFTFENLKGAETTIERLHDFKKRLQDAHLKDGVNLDLEEKTKNYLADFEEALDDNLNTSVALAALHNLVREVNTALAHETVCTEDRSFILHTLDKFDSVLGIFGEEKQEMLDAEIESLIEERQEARRQRNFARSDEIRDSLAEKGIILEDTKDGVRWKRK